MELITVNDNPYGQNVYFYFCKETGEGGVIDPGDCFEAIKKTIEDNKIKISAILLTHGHFDHTFRTNEVREFTNAPVYAHSAETELLQNPEYNRSGYRGLDVIVKPDKHFSDGDVFTFQNGETLKVIHTPGHTAGGVCYYDEKAGVIFTGDTLFRGTIGRTDMPTGNHAELIKSVKEKLFTLPENVTVYPGHEESSSIRHEKQYNRAV
ncbi:MAG: MBL fold metallo-hydrolase [Defluviitaleaceae bacterium]|nr:MBL fold metallo-hydrolase [Defluviitaleaceae bacterium]MCL2262365.1 MBL fold metallo-hydrolase [Defluviitaleaceae bacterium]